MFHKPLGESKHAERRLHQRYSVNEPVRLQSETGTMGCRLLDISAGGARLGLDSLSMPAFRSDRWKLDLPTGVSVAMRPVWCGRSEAGVAFLLDDLARAKVARIIARYYAGT